MEQEQRLAHGNDVADLMAEFDDALSAFGFTTQGLEIDRSSPWVPSWGTVVGYHRAAERDGAGPPG
jgi:hypothetical protein